MSLKNIFNYLNGPPDRHFTLDELFGKRSPSASPEFQTTRAGRFVERTITLSGCFLAVSAAIASANPLPLAWCLAAKAGGIAGQMVTNSVIEAGNRKWG